MTGREGAGRIWVPSDSWLGIETEPSARGGLFLAMVLALAAATRFLGLGSESIWIDEFATWTMCNPGPGHDFWEQIRDMIQGPLYLAMVWPFAHGAMDETLIRLPSAIAGTAATPLVWLVGRRLAGERAGRLAALMWALCPFAIWYGREARGYAPAMFFSLAAFLQWLRLIDGRVRPAGAAGFGLLAAMAIMCNFSAAFLIGSLGLATLALGRGRRRSEWLSWGLAALVVIAVWAPWLLRSLGIHAVERLVPGAETGAGLRGETTFSPLGYPFTVLTFFFGYSLGPSLAELHLPDRIEYVRRWLPLIAPAGLAACAAAAAGLWRLRGRRAALLTALILIPTILLTVLAVRNVKTFNPRYLAVVQPLALVLAAAGVTALPRRAGSVLGGLLVGLMLYSFLAGWADPRYHKEDSRAAAASVAEYATAGEPILVPDVTNLFRLYYRGEGEIMDMWEAGEITDLDAARGELAERIGDAPSCWLVRSVRSLQDPRGLLAPALRDMGRIVDSRDHSGLRVMRWVRADGPRPDDEAGSAPADGEDEAHDG